MRSRYVLTLILLSILCSKANSQFPYSETFQNGTAPGIVMGGSAKLTAATGADPAGQGYLRLTDNGTFSIGYAYCQQSFPSSYGITASFEFFMWKSDALGYNQADGITFFLFDASTNSFRPGGTGGSLGYTNYYTTPGVAKGYMGIALDGFGNYSNPGDGNKPGGPGRRAGAVVVRGPGNGITATDYVYQTGVTASDAPYNAGFLGFTQRYPVATSANYRKVQIILTPGSTLGAAIGYTVTVKMIKGGSPSTSVTLINNYDYPFAAPGNLKFGVAGSTGSIYNYQEIRNMTITATNTSTLLTPALLPDLATTCGGTAIIDPIHNDATLNMGGRMNGATVDLDPVTAGRQTTYTDGVKGTYTVDSAGIVSFVPQSGFSGISSISYTAADSYGALAALPSLITVTVNPLLGPLLTLTDPTPVCFPATVNLTNPVYKILTTPGASYDYFNTLAEANNNTSNINSTAAALATSGTYYVRASLLGCATVRPITVQVSAPPTTANAGSDLASCSATSGFNATLLATNPAIGIGTWTQVSGTATAPVNYLNAATTPVLNMPQGVYTYRWTVNNGACASSSDDVVITVGVPSNAGTAQTICNATTATLAGNVATPGVGLWTRTAGPSLTIANSASATSGLTGLVPGNSYTMQWRITNGACVNTSTVTITNVLNTMANAGADRAVSIPSTALAGNTPDAGNTGTWMLVSGPSGNTAAIAQPSNALSAITGLNKTGEYTFRWTIANGIFSNSDEVKITFVSVLPVKLISFKGTEQAGKVLLYWQTASEQENDHYEIERSEDGVNFTVIGVKKGAGNSSSLINYTYQDDVSAITGGVLYYRLRQVDTDGRVTVSSVVKIVLNNSHSIVVSPNPFTSEIKLDIYSNESAKGNVSLYGSSGKLIKQEWVAISKGHNAIAVKDLGVLPAGVITVLVKVNNKMFSQVMIKR